ncbi:TIGR02996 domain-containing protein [Symbioplanes lichenis]|uniref:TIGR02996 domain-containing protein n=1 Tax=Symbioplanes lichenis TaxID=1629072 RepID=UPI0034DB4E00
MSLSAAELYAAVLAAPDDLDVRLAYADAAEGSDPRHARLIREQIAATRREHVRLMTLVERPNSGLAYFRGPGFGDDARLLAKFGVDAEWLDGAVTYCGFPEAVMLSGAAFLEHGASLYERLPVRHVALSGVDAALATRLAGSPLVDRLSSLALRLCPLGNDGLRALGASDRFRRLRHLDLYQAGITDADAFVAALPERMPALQWLNLDGNDVSVQPWPSGFGHDGGIHPLYVDYPGHGAALNERFGPFAWMRGGWAWQGGPFWGTV